MIDVEENVEIFWYKEQWLKDLWIAIIENNWLVYRLITSVFKVKKKKANTTLCLGELVPQDTE